MDVLVVDLREQSQVFVATHYDDDVLSICHVEQSGNMGEILLRCGVLVVLEMKHDGLDGRFLQQCVLIEKPNSSRIHYDALPSSVDMLVGPERR